MNRNKRWQAATVAAVLVGCGLAIAASSRADAPAPPAKSELLTRERETAAALSAGPSHFADQAGVYVLEQSGYVKVRESKNGFTCIVDRDSPQSFEPECMDAEGTETSLPRILYRAELRVQGKSEAEIGAAIAEGYTSGRFRAPRRPGIVYMLSKENRVVADPATGRIVNFPPHVMFYAPYLTNADIGAGPGGPAFVISEGTPGALVIVTVPQPKAEAKK